MFVEKHFDYNSKKILGTKPVGNKSLSIMKGSNIFEDVWVKANQRIGRTEILLIE